VSTYRHPRLGMVIRTIAGPRSIEDGPSPITCQTHIRSLDRLAEQLSAEGVTEADIQREVLEKSARFIAADLTYRSRLCFKDGTADERAGLSLAAQHYDFAWHELFWAIEKLVAIGDGPGLDIPQRPEFIPAGVPEADAGACADAFDAEETEALLVSLAEGRTADELRRMSEVMQQEIDVRGRGASAASA